MEESKTAATGLFEPASVVSAMEVVATRFTEGKTTKGRDIAEDTGLAESIVAHMLGHLVEHHLLHWVDAEESAVTLARPPEKISAEELLHIGFQLADEGSMGRRSGLIEKLRAAQRELAANMTLATLVNS
jgi:DNA-binding IscR family transcriptional regulator